MAKSKTGLRDLRAMREHYDRVLEQHVIYPALGELNQRRERLQTLVRSGDKREAAAFQAELKKVDGTIELLDRAATRVGALSLSNIERVLKESGR
jgi:hypothetical protein